MMRYNRLVLVLTILLVALLCGITPSFAQDRSHRFVLENGMKVILQERHSSPVAAVQLWVRVGSGDESDEESGICHFIEHMLFKGTERRKAREFAREIESLGGNMNAYTSYDQTVYHTALASRFIDTALEGFSDAVHHSAFDPMELEKEREVVLEEIRRGRDDPSRVLFNQTTAARFRVHPYRRSIAGDEGTIRKITRDQMVAFFKKWYRPDRMVLIVAGDFNLREMEEKVRAIFGGASSSGSGTLPQRPEEPEPEGLRVAIAPGNVKEAYLQIAVPIPSAAHEDGASLDALSHVLGGGDASRLVQNVKLEKGLVHSISTSAYRPKDPGLFIIGATLAPEKSAEAVKAILEEVARVRREGVSEEELGRVKKIVEGGLIYDRQTVQGEARKLGYYEVTVGDPRREAEYLTRVSRLQTLDLQNAIEAYFQPSRLIISIVAPTAASDLLKRTPWEKIVSGVVWKESEAAARKDSSERRIVLENGVRLVVKENRSLPAVSMQAAFLGGVRWEEASQSGISHFAALMLTKGTKDQSALQITKKMERMAGSINGFSGYNSLGVNLTCLSQHFEEAFALLAEAIRTPSFDPSEMEKRRPSILASIRLREDDLAGLTLQLFRRTLYEKHPYRMDVLGTADSVRRLTREDLKAFYERLAVPDNLVLTVVGDVDADAVVRAAGAAFGTMEGRVSPPPVISEEAHRAGFKRAEILKEKQQAHFFLGFLGGSTRNEDRYALEVVHAALSGQGGRLFYELRDKESLAYALFFTAQPNFDPGYIGLYMGTHPAKLEAAIARVLVELRKVREEGLTPEEIERAKKYLIGNFEIGLQTNAAQANQICMDELYGSGHDHYRKYPEAINRVTNEQVNQAIRKYFNLDAYTIAVVLPPGGNGS